MRAITGFLKAATIIGTTMLTAQANTLDAGATSGFIYNSSDQGIDTIDVMRFDQFPEQITDGGENPNLVLRAYVGENCIPLYEFTGDDSTWLETLFDAEPAPSGDGNVLKFVKEGVVAGHVAFTFNEMILDGTDFKGFAPLDGQFEGVSYRDIQDALTEANLNKHRGTEPEYDCRVANSFQPQSVTDVTYTI